MLNSQSTRASISRTGHAVLRVSPAVLSMMIATGPAFAQGVGTNPTTTLTTLAGYFMTAVGVIIVCACGINGIRCVNDGRHLGPAIMGAVGGTLLAAGGAFLVSQGGFGNAGIAL